MFILKSRSCSLGVTLAVCVGLLAVPTPSHALLVPGTSDPWLAGMPAGSNASITDFAPGQSPLPVAIPGNVLTFSAIGAVSNGPCCGLVGPDGGGVTSHLTGAENGISDILAPINSLLGIFLDASQPNLSLAPGALDFSTPASQDYLALSPGLKQVFFIGDGLTSGNIAQQVIVPAGATRLFLGTMDGFEWINNLGVFEVTVTSHGVPEPASLLILGSGLAGIAVLALRRPHRR